MSSDGSYALDQSEEGMIQVVQKINGSVVAGPFEVHHHSLSVFRFSHDNSTIIMASGDEKISILPLLGGEAPVHISAGHTGRVTSIAQAPNCCLFASHSSGDPEEGPSLRVWNVATPTIDFEPHSNPLSNPTSDHAHSTIHEEWHIREDGWAVNPNNDLLFWFPIDIARRRPSSFTSLIVTGAGTLQIPKQKLYVGEQWSKCYIRDCDAVKD